MPIFEYKAYNESGAPKTGIVDADTPSAARVQLRAERIHAYELDEIQDGKDSKKGRGFSFKRKASIGELSIVTRQFATLLSAGITVVDTLKALIDQVESRDMEQTFRDVREKVTQGETLGEALERHPRYFGDLYVNMIKAGEASGNLDVIMIRLADYLQKQNKMKNKVTTAMAYPTVLMIVGVIVVSVLLTVVVPKIQDIFRDAEKALPTITILLINVSEFMQDWWWGLLLGAIAIVVGVKLWRRTEAGGMKFDTLILKIPVLGMLLKKQAISRFATTMATLLQSGLPVLQALAIVRQVIQNKILAQAVHDIHDSIVEGSDIATPLKKTGIFPPMVAYMIATGEQSGQLEDILFKVSEAYDEEVDSATAKLTAVLEPLIIVALAVVVAFIVMAIVLPLIQMSGLA